MRGLNMMMVMDVRGNIFHIIPSGNIPQIIY